MLQLPLALYFPTANHHSICESQSLFQRGLAKIGAKKREAWQVKMRNTFRLTAKQGRGMVGRRGNVAGEKRLN